MSQFTPSRRVTLGWIAAAAASPALAGCDTLFNASGWRDLNVEPVEAPGIGGDPDLMTPSTPWPLTMSEDQRALIRVAADIILPADDRSPAASAVGVDAFIDEWISAPYERQQDDRKLILSGLRWLDVESRRRFDVTFTEATSEQRAAIFDDVAFNDRVKQGYDQPAGFFRRLRGLTLAGFYTMPEGIADIGYLGNSPIMGPYPGPSAEARAHLDSKLAELNLSLPD